MILFALFSISLEKSEYETLSTAAKKYYAREKKESKLQKLLDAANKMILPEAKGKRETNRMAKEWFEAINAEAGMMPNVKKSVTIDEIYKEYLKHQIDTGEIEKKHL